MEIRVTLIEEHVMMREALAKQLEHEADIQVIAQVSNGVELMEYLSSRSGPYPHIVIMAVWFQGNTSITMVQRLRQQDLNIRVIGLIDFMDAETIYRMYKVGAYGCVDKSRTLSDLIDTIRTARYGGHRHDPETERIALGFERHHKTFPTRTGLPSDHEMEQSELTRREFIVLQCLCQAYTNHQIGVSLGISNRTVQTHLTHIYKKLKVSGRTEAVIRAYRYRWVYPALGED